MQELITECLKLVNLPYTLMFGTAMAYWILYVVGAVGADLLDFDLDVDTDMDADADIDMDGDVHHGGGIFATAMKFLHAGDIPLTVVASTMTMGMWIASVLLNYYMHNDKLVIALGLMIPIVVIGMLFTRIGLQPFLPILRKAFDESGDVVEIIGKMGNVVSLEATAAYGQVEIAVKGSPITINVKTKGDEVLKKGDEAVVFGRDDDGETYLVTSFATESDNENAITEDNPEPDLNKINSSGVTDNNMERE
jgi:hypothetical protein